MQQNINFVNIDDPRLGIVVYKTGLRPTLAKELDNLLTTGSKGRVWQTAKVGYGDIPDPSYRKCWDCKITQHHVVNEPELLAIYNEYAQLVRACVDHYASSRRAKMEYMEAINFVKYGPGEHFAAHADDGFSYSATISTVGYLNDDYSGGELDFPTLGIRLKPETGDIITFPSSFIYQHASLPVAAGTKFSAVTMFDWNDKWHQYHGPSNPKPPTFHPTA